MTKHIKLSRRAGGRDAGAIITVSTGAAAHLIEQGYGDAASAKQAKAYADSQADTGDADTGSSTSDPIDYSKLTNDELNAEVDRRNEEREDEDTWVVPTGTVKADLVAALEADDDRA